MNNTENKSAPYKIIFDAGGNRYRFFCERSGMAVCTTGPVRADTPEQELRLAWESEGKKQFNYCHKCDRWVSDEMYNPDTLECILCSPHEKKSRMKFFKRE